MLLKLGRCSSNWAATGAVRGATGAGGAQQQAGSAHHAGTAGIFEWGPVEITPGRHPAEWCRPTHGSALQRVALVGFTLHKAHLEAAAAPAAHDDVLKVIALVHVKGGTHEAPTVVALPKAHRRTHDSIFVPGMSLHCSMRTERVS